MSAQALEETARLYDEAASELERAARHCTTAAEHFRSREIPRGAAHAWAAFGHLREAQERLETQAKIHSRKSNP